MTNVNINQITIGGRLTTDVKKQVKNETKIATSTIAFNYKNETTFVNIKAFNQLAVLLGNYFKKGSNIIVSGILTMDRYTGKDGTKKIYVEVVADKIYFVDTKDDSIEYTDVAPETPKKPAKKQETEEEPF